MRSMKTHPMSASPIIASPNAWKCVMPTSHSCKQGRWRSRTLQPRTCLPRLLASSVLPRGNPLGSCVISAARRTCVRTQVIADPSDVDCIDCKAEYDGEALEQELARHLAMSSVQLDTAAASTRHTSIELPTYNTNKVPGISLSNGLGLHLHSFDPEQPGTSIPSFSPRQRRLSRDLNLGMPDLDAHGDSGAAAASSSPKASRDDIQVLNESDTSTTQDQGPRRAQPYPGSRDKLWGLHDRLHASDPRWSLREAEARPASSTSSPPHASSSRQAAVSQQGVGAGPAAGALLGSHASLASHAAGFSGRTASATDLPAATPAATSHAATHNSLTAPRPVKQLAPAPASRTAPDIPKPILVISLVSASLTLASCVFNTLLPIYCVVELKMSMRSMGMLEGLLEAFSYVVRMFSGVVSDLMTSRKSAITLGFAMGAMAKFGMSAASSVGSLFVCKAIDRLANGVQAAPRDALISDLAPDSSRSACFGFAQSLRKWGSAVGAVMVYFLMKASGNNYQLIFTLAASVSLASCVAFVFLVPSHVRPERPAAPMSSQDGTSFASQPTSAASPAPTPSRGFQMSQFCKDVAGMGSNFYRMLSIIFLLGMGHINESLLEARAIEVGFGKAESTLVVATLSFVIFVVAYPLGRLDDKYGPRLTFAIGMAALIAADLVLMTSGQHPMAVFVSLLFMGVHMGVLQGPLLSIVVGLAPGHLRGTAFGIFYTVMAVTALAANSMFGAVWYSFGATSAFGLSAALTTMTLLALPWLLPSRALVPAAST